MISFTATYPDMTVHRTGCADIMKIANLHADTTVIREAASLGDFLQSELAADLAAMGYTADDFTVKPCAWAAEEGR